MTNTLYQCMALPESCRLDKRVYKKLFLESPSLAATDRRLFRDHIESIIWRYTLKPETINIPAYEDEEREYREIAVLEAVLRKPDKAVRLANLIHRAIPYPICLVLVHGTSVMIHLAPKRTSRADREKWTLEVEHGTHWMDLEKPNKAEQAFLEDLALSRLRLSSYFDLYTDWIACVTALNCAEVTDRYALLDEGQDCESRSETLAAYGELKEELASYRVTLRDVGQFNRQVELNMKIKQTVHRMDDLKVQL